MPLDSLHNESELLQRIANGDEAAFRQLFDYYWPKLYQLAYKLTKDISVTEDILQETFLKVWMKRESLKEISNFGGWLFTIYENFMLNTINRVTRLKKANATLEKNLITQFNLPDHNIEVKEIENVIHKAISRLSEKQNQAFKLIREQGLTRNQAAEIMKVSPETVKTHLENALRSIRAFCLKEFEYHPLLLYIVIFLKIFF